MYKTKKNPLKIMSAEDLNIKGLHLLGHAKFQNTFSTLAPHCHETLECMVILKGTQQYVVGGKEYILHGGDVFVTLPHETHGTGLKPQEVADIIWFQLDITDPNDFLGLSSPFCEYMYSQLSRYQTRVNHTTQKDLKLLEDAFRYLYSKSLQHRFIGYQYFIQFLTRNFAEREELPQEDVDSATAFEMKRAVEYIDMHLTENPNVEDIAAVCGLSATKLHMHFREQMGMTPHVYINVRKIEIAKTRLLSSDISITDLAYELNFSSSDYFSTVFKKYTGDTPTKYRCHNQNSIQNKKKPLIK